MTAAARDAKLAEPTQDDLWLRLGAMREALKALEHWVGAVPHGDNCFICNHYEGDPGNGCNCGRDSALEMIDRVLSAPPAPVASAERSDGMVAWLRDRADNMATSGNAEVLRKAAAHIEAQALELAELRAKLAKAQP